MLWGHFNKKTCWNRISTLDVWIISFHLSGIPAWQRGLLTIFDKHSPQNSDLVINWTVFPLPPPTPLLFLPNPPIFLPSSLLPSLSPFLSPSHTSHFSFSSSHISISFPFQLQYGADCTLLDVDGNFAYDSAESADLKELLLKHMSFKGDFYGNHAS